MSPPTRDWDDRGVGGRRLVRGDRPGRRRRGADERDRQVEAALRPAQARRVPRSDPRPRPAVAGPRGGPATRHAAGPRAAVRSARARQDHAGDDRRRRARAADPDHQRARPSSTPATSPSILSSLAEGEVLFLDEIHRMARPAEEMLYLAMEDFRVDVIVGKGPGATAIPLELPPFTVVGATTRAGLLPGPLRDRFGFTGHLDFYSTDELDRASCGAAPGCSSVEADEAGIAEIATRSRGTPRIANRLLRRVRDWAQVHGRGLVDLDAARAALAMFDVDERGPRPARPRGARGAVPPVRRRTGRASRRSRSPWGRRPTPSRRSPSRSWCARGSWCAPRGAGSPRRWPGSTSGLAPPGRRSTPAPPARAGSAPRSRSCRSTSRAASAAEPRPTALPTRRSTRFRGSQGRRSEHGWKRNRAPGLRRLTAVPTQESDDSATRGHTGTLVAPGLLT